MGNFLIVKVLFSNGFSFLENFNTFHLLFFDKFLHFDI